MECPNLDTMMNKIECCSRELSIWNQEALEYERASGQRMNHDKTTMIFSKNVDLAMQHQIFNF